MVAITVHVVTMHDTDMNAHFVEGVFSTAQLATDYVVEWFNEVRKGELAPLVKPSDLTVETVGDTTAIADWKYEDIYFHITKTTLQES